MPCATPVSELKQAGGVGGRSHGPKAVFEAASRRRTAIVHRLRPASREAGRRPSHVGEQQIRRCGASRRCRVTMCRRSEMRAGTPSHPSSSPRPHIAPSRAPARSAPRAGAAPPLCAWPPVVSVERGGPISDAWARRGDSLLGEALAVCGALCGVGDTVGGWRAARERCAQWPPRAPEWWATCSAEHLLPLLLRETPQDSARSPSRCPLTGPLPFLLEPQRSLTVCVRPS